MSETNTSYVNSGSRSTIAACEFCPWWTTRNQNSFSANLNNLRSGAGTLSSVAALRETFRADLVTLVVRPQVPDACLSGS